MQESYLMELVGIAIGFIIVIMILRTIFSKFSISLSSDSRHKLKDILIWTVNDVEMIRRILITVGIIIILKIFSFLPLPGVDIEVLKEFLSRTLKRQDYGLFGIITAIFSGEIMDRLTISALGLAPFFSSCIILQLASVVMPRLKKLFFAGEKGRRKILKYTYILTIILSLLQSFLIALWLENPAIFEGMRIIPRPGFGFRLICMVAMTTGVIFLLFVADIITRYGIGNGIAVIAISFIPLRLFTAWRQIITLEFGITFIGLIYITYLITNRSKPIELQDDKLNKIFIHFRPTIVGHTPLSFARTIILFLAIPLATPASFALRIAYLVLIAIFTYLYAGIVFKPRFILDIMGKYGYKLIKSKTEEDYLYNNMAKVLMITALFFAGVALIPDLAINFFGRISVAFMVGVFLDIIRQLEFYKDKKESAIENWSICYIAFDEIEAQIKSEYLKIKGISALIEPLRFSWGMPIRTVVDQYRIYVPANKKEEARI